MHKFGSEWQVANTAKESGKSPPKQWQGFQDIELLE